MATKNSVSGDKLDPDEPTYTILNLAEDVICFICVHLEYQDIIKGINRSCKPLHEIVQQFLHSNHYIYRLHIVYHQVDNPLYQKPLSIAQIKYFNQYKHLLNVQQNKKTIISSYDPSKRCTIALRSYFNKFLCAEPSGKVLCDRASPKKWEQFTSIPVSHNTIALQSAHDQFLTPHSDDHTLNTTASPISKQEHFTVHKHENGTFSFQSSGGKFISSQPDGTIANNRQKALKWEQFTVETLDDLTRNKTESLDQKLPISHVLIRYNGCYDDLKNPTQPFKKWFYKHWNSGNFFVVQCQSVFMFDKFMQAMNIGVPPNNKTFDPNTMLSLGDTVKFLRLTTRASPQPINDQNRLCNALQIIEKYQLPSAAEMKEDDPESNGIYGLDIGFHIGDNRKQKYT